MLAAFVLLLRAFNLIHITFVMSIKTHKYVFYVVFWRKFRMFILCCFSVTVTTANSLFHVRAIIQVTGQIMHILETPRFDELFHFIKFKSLYIFKFNN